jgi:RimJ/RimL family protein N-acetyltransferase
MGFALFVDYVFAMWNFHKLYMELPSYNLPQFGSARGRYLDEEGRLRDHLYIGGERHDQVILALHRSKWMEMKPRLVPGGSA